jgi:hypothetical protein
MKINYSKKLKIEVGKIFFMIYNTFIIIKTNEERGKNGGFS